MKHYIFRGKCKLLCLGMVCALLCASCAAEKSLRDYEKGVLAYESADYDKAAEYFEAALDKNPDKAEYYLYYGYTLMELERYEEAKAQFEKAMLDKEIEEIRDNTKRAYRGAGIAAYYQGDTQQAMIYLNLAYRMEELPELNEDIRAYMQQIELERISGYLEVEAFDQALELCEELEKSYGESSYLWVAKGSIANKAQDYREAAEYYEQAILAGDDSITVRIALIASLKAQQLFGELTTEEAEAVEAKIEEMLVVLRTMTPANPDEQEQLGLAFYSVGDYDMAEQWLSTLSSQDGSDKNWNDYLAQIALVKGQYERALQLLQGKSEAELGAEECYQLAFCAVKTGEWELAQAYYDKGIKLVQTDAADMQRWERLEIYLLEQSGAYKEAYERLKVYVESYLTPEAAEWEAMQKELKYLEYRK